MLCFVRRCSVLRLLVPFALYSVVHNAYKNKRSRLSKTTTTLPDARIRQLSLGVMNQSNLICWKASGLYLRVPMQLFPPLIFVSLLMGRAHSCHGALGLALAPPLHSANVSLPPAAAGLFNTTSRLPTAVIVMVRSEVQKAMRSHRLITDTPARWRNCKVLCYFHLFGRLWRLMMWWIVMIIFFFTNQNAQPDCCVREKSQVSN